MKTILFSFSNERNFQETKINASEIFATRNQIIIKQIEILSFVDEASKWLFSVRILSTIRGGFPFFTRDPFIFTRPWKLDFVFPSYDLSTYLPDIRLPLIEREIPDCLEHLSNYRERERKRLLDVSWRRVCTRWDCKFSRVFKGIDIHLFQPRL